MTQKILARIPSTKDALRPRYHYLPPRNWMNDPNGLIQWQGSYHLFYQYNPLAPVWGRIHWGHAESPDLVHWSDLPIALSPSETGPDASGCWSGVIIEQSGKPVMIYTGFEHGTQLPCLAESYDGLVTWQKSRHNPLITAPPPGLDVIGFRDHSIWKEEDGWYMLIGSGLHTTGSGTLFLYRSPDLEEWEYLHPLTTGAEHRRFSQDTGKMWECPSFFPLGKSHVLLISAQKTRSEDYTAVFSGAYQDHLYEPITLGKLDYGDRNFYAPQTFTDSAGRRIIMGWIQECRSVPAQRRAGWAGVMSLPREMYLDSTGRVCQRFVSELQTLRREGFHRENLVIAPHAPIEVDPSLGNQFELQAVLTAGSARRTLLSFLRSPDALEETRLVFDWTGKTVTLDRARSSYRTRHAKYAHTAPLMLNDKNEIDLHLYVDSSVIEVLINGHTAITSRVYPTRSDSAGLALSALGGEAHVSALHCWKLAPIWE